MYSKSKYVVGTMNCGPFNEIVAIVFPENVPHTRIALLFVEGTITGAGFCHYTDDDVKVYGNSVSLRIGSNPEHDTLYVGRAMSHSKYSMY